MKMGAVIEGCLLNNYDKFKNHRGIVLGNLKTERKLEPGIFFWAFAIVVHTEEIRFWLEIWKR